jgi:hypothetical protein
VDCCSYICWYFFKVVSKLKVLSLFLLFAGVILASCDARRLKRQIEERFPSQFGNQFFGNQQSQFFPFPNQNQFNQNQRPQQFNQNQNQFGQPQQQFNQNGQQQQFNPNGQQQQQFNQNGQQQQFNPNGQQQQPQRNPNTQQQQQATQATPTPPPTTLAPAVENCRDGCTSRTTAGKTRFNKLKRKREKNKTVLLRRKKLSQIQISK